MTGECDERDVLALLDDEYARAILRETNAEPLTAAELADRCDASNSTIYRRIERLQECDLIVEQTQFDPDGHHRNVYASRLAGLEVRFEGRDLHLELDRIEPEDDPADRFTRMWQDL